MNNMTLPGLVAHSSTIACSKVLNTVTGLPQLLDVELLSRSVIWPQSFWNSPPTEDNVGIYIFPQYERFVFNWIIAPFAASIAS